MATRTILGLLLALSLAGCYSDQRARLAACEKAADQSPARSVPGEPFKQIQGCMDRAGYRYIGWNDGVVCDLGAVVQGRMSPEGTGAECFEPKGWLALKIYRIEVPARPPRAAG